ncbi:FRG domain-containing protein [Polaribacter sp. 20A6]|uniref:FRG domain-containing protein n=1 Tax=Polaribacter sp. 20A6 TaxID=2687289 RepID=UPI0013FDD4A5|nr:FRG domain-containing protein [Polaribacter sp. 20A6]
MKPVIEIKHSSANKFLQHLIIGEGNGIDPLTGEKGFPTVFRGERSNNPSFKLIPSILRQNNTLLTPPNLLEFPKNHWYNEMDGEKYLLSEFQSLKHFYQTANRNGMNLPTVKIFEEDKIIKTGQDLKNNLDEWLPDELSEIAGIAQHFGIPTRLLDWTFNPLTATYFAVSSAVENYYNNLRLNKNKKPSKDSYEFNNKEKIVVWALNASALKSDFNSDANFNIKIVTPPYSRNPNLKAQNGLFTHVQFGIDNTDLFKDRTPLDQLLGYSKKKRIFLTKHLIPLSDSNRLLQRLVELNQGASKLYPGFDGVAKEIQQRDMRSFISDFWSF